MAKNYTKEYLKVLQDTLEDMANEVQEKLRRVNLVCNGDNPSAARKSVKQCLEHIDTRMNELATDVKKMNYTDFKTKYIEHL